MPHISTRSFAGAGNYSAVPRGNAPNGKLLVPSGSTSNWKQRLGENDFVIKKPHFLVTFSPCLSVHF